MKKNIITNRNLKQLIRDVLASSGTSRKSREIILGWFLSADEQGSTFGELFNDVFRFRKYPSRAAYASLPGLLDKAGLERKPAVRRPLYHNLYFRAAAVLVPLLSAGTIALRTLSDDLVVNPAQSLITLISEDIVPETVELPCGTTVKLRPGSNLTYDAADYLRHRKVNLDGEAYFSVVKTGSAPFTVTVRDLVITVLGTEFNVKADSDSEDTEVSLYNGSVKVNTPVDEILMEPSQQFTYNRSAGRGRIREFDEEVVNGWLWEIDLDNIPLGEAIRHIGRYYGKTVVISAPGFGERTLKAKFRNEPLEVILDILNTAEELFTYEIQSDTLYINPI